MELTQPYDAEAHENIGTAYLGEDCVNVGFINFARAVQDVQNKYPDKKGIRNFAFVLEPGFVSMCVEVYGELED